MSEFINVSDHRTVFSRKFLATTSALALLGLACGASQVRAEDSDRPPLWIELGGQFATLNDSEEKFVPPFLLTTPRPAFEALSPADFEAQPPSSWDGSAKIAFEPVGSDWLFSVSMQYGKGTRHKTLNQLENQNRLYYISNAYQYGATQSSESHAVVDFEAGKDVGLGRFGSNGSSVISLGIRYAQFNSSSDAEIKSQPIFGNQYAAYHKFFASFAARRKFTGVGPSLSWDASAKLFGNPSAGDIALDWGIGGAVLFGRQQIRAHHQTTNDVITNFHTHAVSQYSTSPNRKKQVVVPNIGGFAGVSWQVPGAKVTLGYRADFFFGAMDGGIDAAHRENVGFYGPFASVSVGVGG